MKIKNILFWAITVIISVASAYFQRQTGPTKPYRGSVTIAEQEVDFSLIRTFIIPKDAYKRVNDGTEKTINDDAPAKLKIADEEHFPLDAPVKVRVSNEEISGYFRYKRFPGEFSWDTLQLVRENEYLVAIIPGLTAPGGKWQYQVFLEKNDEQVKLSEDPIIIRFRNDVPAWAMIPHIILMFAAMLFSNRAALAAIGKQKTYTYALLTCITFIGGGLVFGPIVQKYAFGDWWTGWPFGTDLTDNKTAFAMIFWIVALIKARKNPMHRSWVLVAAIVLLLIYYIPHSLMGTEIDWTQEQLP